MIYYVFKNRRNGKYISGTDFRCNRQILADEDRPPKLMTSEFVVNVERRSRKINPATYKVVKVEIKEVI